MKKFLAALSLFVAVPAFASEYGARIQSQSATSDSITVQGELYDSGLGADGMCAILDYDSTQGLYQFAPQASERRQVQCNASANHAFIFSGLSSNTEYWFSLYPFNMGGNGMQLTGAGVAGLPIRTAAKQNLILWGPQNQNFILLPVGQSIFLTASAEEGSNPQLNNVKTQQLSCLSVSPTADGSDNNNAKWKCTALKNLVSTQGNSEVFYTIGNDSSNTIVIQVTDRTEASSSTAAASSSKGRTQLPQAGYEDEVLVNFSAYANPFPDTNINGLEGMAAAELYRRGVIGGFPDGQFKGDRSVNRAEAAKFLLLARSYAINEKPNNGRFADVLDGQWYTKFVMQAAERGIISGYPDGLFRPANQVNTAEFLKMLSLTFGLTLNMEYDYDDVPSSSWFAQYAGIAQKYDLFPTRAARTPNLLWPDVPMTRGEVALAIYQYLSHR